MLDTREDAVGEPERSQAFDQRPLFQRSLIVAAGPMANLLLAIVLYAGAAWVGVLEPEARLASPASGSPLERAGLKAGDRVSAICVGDHAAPDAASCDEVVSLVDLQWHITRAVINKQGFSLQVVSPGRSSERRVLVSLDGISTTLDESLMRRVGLRGAFSEPVVTRVIDGEAASAAGLVAGDRVESVDGVPMVDAATLRDAIRQYSRADGQAQQWRVQRDGRTLLIDVIPRRTLSADAQSPARVGALIGTAPASILVRRGPLDGVWDGVTRSLDMAGLTIRMMGRMVIGEASLKNLSGPLTIADAAGQSAERGVSHYLSFLAVVSVSLFVLNLLPLPMLDGGHLMYHLFEAVTGRAPTEVWLARLQRFGMILLLSIMALALTNDVLRFLGPN
jgi:regulator of sigma E protease